MQRTELANDFDAIAPIYDLLAGIAFGGALGRAQRALLPRVHDARAVLIIGGGKGRFLRDLLRQLPEARVLYIEKSRRMLASARARIARELPERARQVEFRLGTEAALRDTDGPFDLVVTNFFLDLFEERTAQAIVARLRERLACAGRWLFVDFELPARGPMRWYARLLFKLMFVFFGVVSRIQSTRPPAYARLFEGIGLRPRVAQTFYGGAIHAKLLEPAAQWAGSSPTSSMLRHLPDAKRSASAPASSTM